MDVPSLRKFVQSIFVNIRSHFIIQVQKKLEPSITVENINNLEKYSLDTGRPVRSFLMNNEEDYN